MITSEILPAAYALENLQADWDRLYRSAVREPCVSFEWSRAIIRNHLAGRDDGFVVVLRRGAAVVGIAPMMKVVERLWGRRIVTLQPAHEQNSTHSDLLLSEYSPELLVAWLDALSSGSLAGTWDLLRMSRLIEHSELSAGLSGELRRRRRPFRLRPEQPSYYLRLPPTYAAYLSQRSGKFRNYLKRVERKLPGAGAADFVRVHEQAQFDAAYEDLLSIERDSWKHAHGTAISAVPHQTSFYRDLASAALQAGALHLTFLRIQGEPVAYNLGFVANGCYFYLKTSFRERCKPYGVATVGRARLVEQLIADGLSECDFPAEPYEWEKQWTKDLRWHHSLLLYNDTIAGNALHWLNAARDLVRAPAGARGVNHADARALSAPDS